MPILRRASWLDLVENRGIVISFLSVSTSIYGYYLKQGDAISWRIHFTLKYRQVLGRYSNLQYLLQKGQVLVGQFIL